MGAALSVCYLAKYDNKTIKALYTMNKSQKPVYKSPGFKTINLTPRSSVCEEISLIGAAIEIGELDPSTGDIIDL